MFIARNDILIVLVSLLVIVLRALDRVNLSGRRSR